LELLARSKGPPPGASIAEEIYSVNTFEPRLDVLPPSQVALWPDLRAVRESFVLYGGTALALRLGHRASVDFDFFSFYPFQGWIMRIARR
jgi:hypothetical protein